MGRRGVVVLLGAMVIGGGCGGDTGASNNVLIRAGEGGVVRSLDGVLTLVVPPGALAADTRLSITVVPRASWSPSIDPSETVGEVYDIQPSGTVFNPPAVAMWRYETPPPGLATPDGNHTPIPLLVSNGAVYVPSNVEVYDEGPTGSITALSEVPHLTDGVVVMGAINLSWESGRPMNPNRTQKVGDGWVSADGYHERPIGNLNDVQWGAYTFNPNVVEVTGPDEWIAVPSVSLLESARKAGGKDGGFFIDAPGRLGPLHQVPISSNGEERSAISPLPSWKCVAVGKTGYGVLFFSTSSVDYKGEKVTVRMANISHANVTCVAEGSFVQPLPGADIRLGDVCRGERNGAAIACGTPRQGTIDVVVLDPAARAGCESLPGGASLCPPGTSAEGPLTIEIFGVGRATFDPDTGTYVVSPSPLPPPAGDRVEISAEPKGGGGATTITVPLDPPVEDIFSEIDGLSSTLSIPDNDAALLVRCAARRVNVTNDLKRLALASELTSENGRRTGPLLPLETQDFLRTNGFTVDSCTVGAVRVTVNADWFAEPVLVAAGRFMTVAAAELEPMSMLPPGVQLVACGSLPYDFVEYTTGATAVVCISQSNGCRVTNAVDSSVPLESWQCATNDRALVMNRAPFLQQLVGSGWDMHYATSGVDSFGNVTTARADTDESVVIQRQSDRARFKIDLRASTSGVRVSQAAPFTGPHPAWGASFDCLDTPRTFSTSFTLGSANVYARVCHDNNACKLFGDIDSTPESETCVGDYMLMFFHRPDLPDVFVRAGHPNQAGWRIESTTAGTIDGTARNLSGLPTGSDVTIVTSYNGSDRYRTVFQWTGAAFVIQSITRL